MKEEVIDLDKLGINEYRSDTYSISYVKKFVLENYKRKIDVDLAMIIIDIIDDLVSDILEENNKK